VFGRLGSGGGGGEGFYRAPNLWARPPVWLPRALETARVAGNSGLPILRAIAAGFLSWVRREDLGVGRTGDLEKYRDETQQRTGMAHGSCQ
jgi:hypothetical protein